MPVETLPGWAKAWPPQRKAIDALVSGRSRGLWAVTAAGKTVSLMLSWGALGFPRPLLILTQAMGRDVYGRDAAWALGRDYIPAILTQGSAQGPGVHTFYGRRFYTSLDKALSEAPAVVVNYEILRRRFTELQRVPWRAAIFDEVHEVRGAVRPAKKRDGKLEHKRFHLCRALADGVRGYGGPVWSGTATPYMNYRRELFPQIDLVAPGAVGSVYSFLTKFCGAYKNDWGGLVDTGASETEEFGRVLDSIFCVITRDEIAPWLPPLRRDVRYVPCDHANFHNLGGGVETALDRAAEMKIPAVRDLSAQCLSEGLKIAIITTRRRIAHKITLELTSPKFGKKLPERTRNKLDVLCVTGEEAAIKRRETVRRFNEQGTGPIAMVASIKAIALAMDIQQVDIVIVAGLPTDPGILMQLEGRFSRAGGRPVLVIFLIAEGTIDEPYKVLVIDKLEDVAKLRADTQGSSGIHGTLSGGISDKELIDRLAEELVAMGGG